MNIENTIKDKVFNTIQRYSLFKNAKNILVAVSGGKDSTAALYFTKRYIYENKLNTQIDAIFIDIYEDLKDYHLSILKIIENICKTLDINLKIISFRDFFKFSFLEKIGKEKNPCKVCGVLKRYILNKIARSYDVLVTGHNLDDEAQSIIMNLINSNISVLARLGVTSGIISHDKFTKRVKPLYFVLEKEIEQFIKEKRFIVMKHCPYRKKAYRNEIRILLDTLEKENKHIKLNIVKKYLKIKPKLIERYKDYKIHLCKLCGEPASGEICKTCQLLKELKER